MSFESVLMSVGVGLLAGGLALFVRQQRWLKRAVLAEGEVVELVSQRDEGTQVRDRSQAGLKFEPKLRYRPVVRFQTLDGRQQKFTSGLSFRPAPFQPGQHLPVRYDQQDARRAIIDTFVYRWFSVLMLLGFGLLTLLMGLLAGYF